MPGVSWVSLLYKVLRLGAIATKPVLTHGPRVRPPNTSTGGNTLCQGDNNNNNNNNKASARKRSDARAGMTQACENCWCTHDWYACGDAKGLHLFGVVHHPLWALCTDSRSCRAEPRLFNQLYTEIRQASYSSCHRIEFVAVHGVEAFTHEPL